MRQHAPSSTHGQPLTGKGLADQAVSFVGAGVSLARNPEQWNNGEAGLALAQRKLSTSLRHRHDGITEQLGLLSRPPVRAC